MTQCERIVKYMEDFGSISPMEAMQDLGCQRLAARIADLRDQGVGITSEWETKKNRYGESTTYKRYRLEETNA